MIKVLIKKLEILENVVLERGGNDWI